MKRWLITWASLLALISGTAWSLAHASMWSRRHESAALEARVALAKAERLSRLPRAVAEDAEGSAATADLLARLHRSLLSAGLPTSVLREVSPLASGNLASGLQAPQASVSLASLDLEGLGRFLAAWRNSEPTWSVASIEVTSPRSPRVEEPGLTIRLTLALASS